MKSLRVLLAVCLAASFLSTLASAHVDTAWVRRYNNPLVNGNEAASALVVDDSGNVYVAGYGWGASTRNDFLTIKYNSTGILQWTARYNGPRDSTDEACALAVDPAGNVYVTGRSYDSASDFDYATVKYNSVGVQQWVVRYNGPGNGCDEPRSIAVDDSGDCYVTGYSLGSGTGSDYATIKYRSDGSTAWVARYDNSGHGNDDAIKILVDRLGNVYVTGFGRAASPIYSDIVTLKYGPAGDVIWVVGEDNRFLAVSCG